MLAGDPSPQSVRCNPNTNDSQLRREGHMRGQGHVSCRGAVRTRTGDEEERRRTAASWQRATTSPVHELSQQTLAKILTRRGALRRPRRARARRCLALGEDRLVLSSRKRPDVPRPCPRHSGAPRKHCRYSPKSLGLYDQKGNVVSAQGAALAGCSLHVAAYRLVEREPEARKLRRTTEWKPGGRTPRRRRLLPMTGAPRRELLLGCLVRLSNR